MIKVLHISNSDRRGGAEQFSYDFVHSSPCDCKLLVRHKASLSDKVFEFDDFLSDRMFSFFDKVLYKAGLRNGIKQILAISENFNFTYSKLKRLDIYREANIIHLHNIHGGYFDLNALLQIAKEKPIVWTLHDMWAVTGGEAHTFGNDNYKKGIGKTPYAHIYPLNDPAIERRQYFINKKKRIYQAIAKNSVWVPASVWLEKCVMEAYVYSSSMKVKTIHYGIDLEIFKNAHLRTWSTPRILFFNSRSEFKGSKVFLDILDQITIPFDLYVAGEKIGSTHPHIRITHCDYVEDRKELASLYNSCDLLIFPSRADTFPFTILEAMACGLCVVASNVCGIPEQLQNNTGILFESENKRDLLEKITNCLSNVNGIREIGDCASRHAGANYALKQMHDSYLAIYHSLTNIR